MNWEKKREKKIFWCNFYYYYFVVKYFYYWSIDYKIDGYCNYNVTFGFQLKNSKY